MSANNWGICPRCKERVSQADKAALAAVEKHYGKIPPAEYAELVKEANRAVPLGESLREDWEIRTNEKGILRISYGCRCQVCGFQFSFNKKINVLTNEEAKS